MFLRRLQLVLTEAREGVLQQYGVIREALEQEEQAALQCVAQEESRVLKGLEETLGRLQSSLQDIQQGLHTLETLADAKGERRIQDQAFIMVSGRIYRNKMRRPDVAVQTFDCVLLFSFSGVQQRVSTVSGFLFTSVLNMKSGLALVWYNRSQIVGSSSSHTYFSPVV